MKKTLRFVTAALFMFAITGVGAATLNEGVNVSIEKSTQDQDGGKQEKEKKSCCKSGDSKKSCSKDKESCSKDGKKGKKSCCKDKKDKEVK